MKKVFKSLESLDDFFVDFLKIGGDALREIRNYTIVDYYNNNSKEIKKDKNFTYDYNNNIVTVYLINNNFIVNLDEIEKY